MYLLTAPIRAAGRLGLAGVFITGGWDAAMRPEPRTKRAARLGVPMPSLAVRANGAAMVLFGSTLALGIRPRLSALVLAGLLVPTTYAGHPFWEESDASVRGNHQAHFLKNVAVMGGLLEVIGQPGRPRKAGKPGRKAARARARAEKATARTRAEDAMGSLWEKAATVVG